MSWYEEEDKFDRIPDPILITILNNVGDVKSLGRCSSVSTRFRSLVPLVDSVHVTVDCVISDDDTSSVNKPRGGGGGTSLSSFLRLVLRPFFSLIGGKGGGGGGGGGGGSAAAAAADQLVTHHSPVQVLKNFSEIKVLKIELPSGELGVEEGVLLKWRASFGSTLDNCVILGASSVVYPTGQKKDVPITNSNEDNGSIPDSFYTNGGLKLRVVWTISSLIAASARHYLLQPIISDHKTLNNLILTDGDGQGVLCMNKDQLEELRVKPLSASSASKRTLVPALNMRLWYAPHLELPDGTVLKGATLVAIRPSEQAVKKEVTDVSWVLAAFEEPFGTAAKMLVKRRTYCLEMNSF